MAIKKRYGRANNNAKPDPYKATEMFIASIDCFPAPDSANNPSTVLVIANVVSNAPRMIVTTKKAVSNLKLKG